MLQVVASTQVVADWVRQIGGDAVQVRALVPAGADVHTLELTTGDVRAIADADLVVINGAGLEAAYNDIIEENADRLLDLAEAIEAQGVELAPFGPAVEHDEHDEHEEEEHEEEEHDQHEEEEHGHDDTDVAGRLIVADALEAHLSVIDLMSDEVDSRIFAVAAPRATVYPSPTHRYAIVLARGPEDGDDRIHVFDGGVFLVEHDDHYDLITQPVSRHALEIADEQPIQYVNSYGWTAIFADINGHAILINEEDLVTSRGDYEPIVLEAGSQHGAALMISEDRVIVSSNNPDYPEETSSSLPLGVEVRTLDNEVVYDASNRSCLGLHGEAHNEHSAIFGCTGGALFVHAHDGEYEHELIPYPAEVGETFRIGSFYGHHHAEHFYGSAVRRDGEAFTPAGIWLVDAARGEMREVFSEPTAGVAFSSGGQVVYVLGADGVLHALDAHDGSLIETMELVEPGEAGNAAMIVVGEMLYVADPNSGHVLAVHLAELEVEAEWEVGGTPSRLAFVGVADTAGAPHAGHDEDGHDEDEHEDGHDEDEHEDEHDEDEHEDEHDEDEHEDDGHGHAHGDFDPHFWFDADLAILAIGAIAEELSALRPNAADTFDDRRGEYIAAVEEADAEVRQMLADLPEERRYLVTFHDAFGYFARRYNLTVAGFVVEGPEQSVSAETIAELVELMEHEGIDRIYREPQFESASVDAVADETGAEVGIIFSQPAGEMDTYIDLLLANGRAIAAG